MRLLSGDQAGVASATSFDVSWRTLLPFAFMTKISPSPSRTLTNAILLPSGDQAGWVSAMGFRVRFSGKEPSAFMT